MPFMLHTLKLSHVFNKMETGSEILKEKELGVLNLLGAWREQKKQQKGWDIPKKAILIVIFHGKLNPVIPHRCECQRTVLYMAGCLF